ncbi:MAG: UDP-N-acetylglucosamine 1-carboxyvinyltransferase [Planctomycetes bacterium]|nr:UDP-N-acetylglucosamine 1-carboxyvinyltransferase [Planctomycetota bacterium]
MDVFVIEGGRRLEGNIRVNGSKNAALPLMAAALLTDDKVTFRDIPDLADIRNMVRLLAELGCLRLNEAEGFETGVHTFRNVEQSQSHATYDIVRTMRASICVLGPLLAKRGQARIAQPGGCSIGDRPVDLHLRGLRALGAHITLEQGDIVAKAPAGGLRGATIFLGGRFGSTVLGTANVLSAAVLAKGTTVIESAACEPEIVDLAEMLIAMGAKITGHGSPRIRVEGVKELSGVNHRVIADRIEAGTFIAAAAITNGDLTIENCPIDAMLAVRDRFDAAGVNIRTVNGEDELMRATVRVTADRVLKPVELTTQPHPGFPTDLQAQFMAMLCLADGNSVITERIFPERFLHVAELSRMGANLFRQGATVVISGVRKLVGAPVMASDLRASACLVLAGLAAEGTTVVHRVYHLDRGYDNMEGRLANVGARITRTSDANVPAAATEV